MSQDKPATKENLLQELESIRSFLNDELSDDDIPILTSVADSEILEKKGGTTIKTDNAESNNTELEPDFILDDEEELEGFTANTDNAIISAREEDGDLQRQTSLFDDELLQTDKESGSLAHSDPQDTKQQTRAQSRRQKKLARKKNRKNQKALPAAQSSDNPFLPPHIRERLGKHKEIINEIQGHPRLQPTIEEPINKFETSIESSPTLATTESTESKAAASSTDNDALIEQAISEFMPVIERRLRELLIEKLKHNEINS
ncbi:hypothetical protein [Agaribacterium sp. ZY112]|uniref:hypothetical protein n=1 Tax=Agaribacterium sp. ZY112 TaxID=3233574 RepID=UPI00352658BB